MNKYFNEVKKTFGFGCMRLPKNGSEIDYAEFSKMIDTFIENGFNYFDTAHGYHDGLSETAIKECLSKRHKRTDFLLTNKLTTDYFKSQEDIRPFFESQLENCGVDYFDFYLMHALNADTYEKYKKCGAFETAFELKKEGKIHHVGISFHDSADVLDKILSEYAEIEVVQIQFNYVDYNDAGIQSRLCYEVCRKYNKPIIVMEPVKGGSLINLPEKAQKVFDKIGNTGNAEYAIRYTAGFEGIMMVLSGMSNMEQLEDNISFMKDFKPLGEQELNAIKKVCEIFRSQNLIACTSCRYCTAGCPKNIPIPEIFSCMNAKKQYDDWNSDFYYMVVTQNRGKASYCIKCGKCERSCPQKLEIRKLLEKSANQFEKNSKEN